MTKLRATALGFLMPSVALLLMAQTSGLPTRPGGSTTQVQYNSSGAFAGDAGMTYNAATDTLTVGACSGCGAPAFTQHSFTLSFTNACATTSTILMSAAKFGSIVSMRGNGSFSTCTGDTTVFSTAAADVPAALIPDANACFSIGNAASDNGLAVSALWCIQSDGAVVIQECPLDGVAGFGCASGTWTASGNRFINILSDVFTYNVDQTP